MLKRHYDIAYDDFHPTKEEEDSSHVMDGFKNIYDHEPAPVVVPPVVPKVDPVVPKVDPVVPKVDPVVPKLDPVVIIIPGSDPVIKPGTDLPTHDSKNFMPNEKISGGA
jgi:hypothetical protein